MADNSSERHIKHWTPAIYHIEVEGSLPEAWSDRLGGMRNRLHSLDRDVAPNVQDISVVSLGARVKF